MGARIAYGTCRSHEPLLAKNSIVSLARHRKASHTMKSAFILTCLAGMSVSCVGDPQLVLKGPVSERCAAAGLRDCRNLTQAALLYADRNPVDGRSQLLACLNDNRGKPNELERFALGLEQVSAVSAGGEYQAPLQPAVYLLRQMAQHEIQAAALQNHDARPAVKSEAFSAKPPRLLASTVALPRHSTPIIAPESGQQQPPTSVFFMLAGNALAGDCRFPGAPMMRCVHEDVEIARIVSDISVSPACPYDVLFASRHGIDLDWATYAPAGKGAEVHAAELPLIPGRTLTAGVGYTTNDATPDVRCGITVVWRDVGEAAQPRTVQHEHKLTFTPSAEH